MPPPLSTFNRSRWLAFFAELTAKLTHHNALVVMEGCEMLKRLLLSRISIAAVLQERDLLQCLLDTIVGGVRSTRSDGPSPDLNDELAVTQLGTLALCVDLIVALHADGEPYYCILVQGRLATIIDALVHVFAKQHAHLHGFVAKLLASLLPLSASRRTAVQLEVLLLQATECSGDGGAGPSVTLRCHINDLVAGIDRQGEALQRAADVAGELVSRSEGPVRLAAIALLHRALRRIDAFSSFRRQSDRSSPSTPVASHDDDAINTSSSPSHVAYDTSEEVHRADVDVTINAQPAAASSTRKDGASTLSSSSITANDASASEADGDTSDKGVPRSEATDLAKRPPLKKEEAATGGTREGLAVPEDVLVAALTAVGASRSHEEFYCAMNGVWCLMVADGAALARHFTPAVFDGLRRFLTRPPATRPDRLVFLAALYWVGHIVTSGDLPAATRRAVQEVGGNALLRMLLPESHKSDEKDASVNASGGHKHDGDGVQESQAPTSSLGSAVSAAAMYTTGSRHSLLSERYTTPLQSSVEPSIEGPCVGAALPLLPYAMAECRTRESPVGQLAELPPVAGAVMSFVLNVGQTCGAEMMARWVTRGAVLRVVVRALLAVAEVQSVLLESPTALDGALNDEVYLDGALRAVRNEDTVLAMLACKLLVTVLMVNKTDASNADDYTPVAGPTQQCEELVSRTLLPLLAKVAIHNPTLTSVREDVAGSALYHSPGNPRSARYTALGECALIALDACLSFGQRANGPVTSIAELLPLLPHLLRCTRHSVHPPLRAITYRTLLHLCHTRDDVMMVLREMPTLLNAAVATVLGYGAEAAQCECAAAAEWLRRVVTLDMVTPATTGSRDDESVSHHLTSTALPSKLLEVTAAAVMLGGQTGGGVCYATACLLSLLVALHETQCRSSDGASAQTSVLTPQGPLSRDAWATLVYAVTEASRRLAEAASVLHGGDTSRPVTRVAAFHTMDARARALSTVEGVAVQYHFTALLLCGLHGVLTLERTGSAQGCDAMPPAEAMGALLTSVLAVPTPTHSVALVRRRLGVTDCDGGVALADAVTARMLNETYVAMLSWCCRLAVAWLTTIAAAAACASDVQDDTHAVRHARDITFPPSLYTSLAARMSDTAVSAALRHDSLPSFVNALLLLPSRLRRPVGRAVRDKGDDGDGSGSGGEKSRTVQGKDVANELATHAAALFEASLTLDARQPAVAAMQCRLMRDYAAATQRACGSSQWLTALLSRLERAATAATTTTTTTAAETTEYAMALSLVCSLVASPHCAPLTREQLQTISAVLCEGMRFAATTRPATLQALRVIAGSTQGRRCLLHEISTTGEPLSRTCFGRLLAITLQLPSQWSSPRHGRPATTTDRVTGGNSSSSNSGGGGGGRADGLATSSSAECVLGCEVCAAVCAEGDEAGFVAAVVRFRAIDKLRQIIEDYDARQKEPLPLHLLRLLAALSFSAEVQKVLFRYNNLVTIIIEAAGEASVQGVLALLVLRNLCFHTGLKTVLCQDDRVLLTLKAALVCQPYVEVMVIADAVRPATRTSRDIDAATAATGNNHRNNPTRMKGVITLRDDLSAQSTALQDWAKHVAFCAASRQQGGGMEVNKPTDAPRRRHATMTSDGGETTATEGDELSLQYLLGKRQHLAMTALWSLVHNHQRGKMYVREVLQQEPAVDLRRLRAMPGTETALEWDEGIENLLLLIKTEQ